MIVTAADMAASDAHVDLLNLDSGHLLGVGHGPLNGSHGLLHMHHRTAIEARGRRHAHADDAGQAIRGHLGPRRIRSSSSRCLARRPDHPSSPHSSPVAFRGHASGATRTAHHAYILKARIDPLKRLTPVRQVVQHRSHDPKLALVTITAQAHPPTPIHEHQVGALRGHRHWSLEQPTPAPGP